MRKSESEYDLFVPLGQVGDSILRGFCGFPCLGTWGACGHAHPYPFGLNCLAGANPFLFSGICTYQIERCGTCACEIKRRSPSCGYTYQIEMSAAVCLIGRRVLWMSAPVCLVILLVLRMPAAACMVVASVVRMYAAVCLVIPCFCGCLWPFPWLFRWLPGCLRPFAW
jgi:hypothetical protein